MERRGCSGSGPIPLCCHPPPRRCRRQELMRQLRVRGRECDGRRRKHSQRDCVRCERLVCQRHNDVCRRPSRVCTVTAQPGQSQSTRLVVGTVQRNGFAGGSPQCVIIWPDQLRSWMALMPARPLSHPDRQHVEQYGLRRVCEDTTCKAAATRSEQSPGRLRGSPSPDGAATLSLEPRVDTSSGASLAPTPSRQR
jgi:hypothetical protein